MRLGVNIDHVATLRQARYREEKETWGGMIEPDPVALAKSATKGGADGITLHLREDRRHIQDEDLFRMKKEITHPLNLEMACNLEMLDVALRVKPDNVCLVPEGREEVTTEGGLDIIAREEQVVSVLNTLLQNQITVSLFIDPDEEQIKQAKKLKCPFIELNTGRFSQAFYKGGMMDEWQRLFNGAVLGNELGIKINAGHGINYENIAEIIKIPYLYELNIGHSIISRAMWEGMSNAVARMKKLCLKHEKGLVF